MKGNIYINGLIGTLLDNQGRVKEKGIELIDVILQVKNQPKAESFNVYINSPGGVVTTGFEIYDYLRGLNRPVNTIGQGMVASIATVIFMAGHNRELKAGTDFFLHLPQGGVEGSSDDIQAYSSMIKDVEKRILKHYKDTAGLDESEILPLLQKETLLTVDEVYKLGFSNVKAIKVEPVAYFEENKPKPIKMSKTDKTSIWKKLQNILKDEVILNKVVFDAEQNEIDFYELEEDATPAVGDKARLDGKDVEGEVVVPSEENPDESVTYVFVAGELTEIKEAEAPAEEEAPEEDATEALKAEVEILKEQLAEATALVAQKDSAITSLKEDKAKLKNVVAKIKALESDEEIVNVKEKESKPETKKATTSLLGDAITNLTNKKKNGL